MKVCTVDGCGRKRVARGWCSTHWKRWRTTGDVQPDVPVRPREVRITSWEPHRRARIANLIDSRPEWSADDLAKALKKAGLE